jgi:hypothetical protein
VLRSGLSSDTATGTRALIAVHPVASGVVLALPGFGRGCR